MTAPERYGIHEPLPTFSGTPPFPIAAREALADAQLRTNLRHATTTIRNKRARAVGERADWEELRLAGAAIKDEVLRDLPGYLQQLEGKVTAAGGVVHWARDAAEANAIVVDIVRASGSSEVVKVKSMTTQEIELNEALAEAGIDAWETDLAELIVQLGHDLPSHILVPAIHRNRSEIRDIFTSEMKDVGRPAPADLTDDPAELAEAARLHLREKFLRAKVAISGGNFAIAETGTVMVVESEGNGRMCLTLPEVLITVLGIEKLLPTLARPGGLPPGAAALLDRRAHEPLHHDVDRRDARRRTPGIPPHPARQRPHERARRRGRPPDAALHPLLGLPQRLPGLRAHRRPGLRVAVPRADRRDPHAAAARHQPGTRSTSRPRPSPTPRRCAAPASRSARFGSTSRRCSCTFERRSWSTSRPSSRRVGKRPRCGCSAGRSAGAGGSDSPNARLRSGRARDRSKGKDRPHPGAGHARRLVQEPRPQGAAARIVPALVGAQRRDES